MWMFNGLDEHAHLYMLVQTAWVNIILCVCAVLTNPDHIMVYMQLLLYVIYTPCVCLGSRGISLTCVLTPWRVIGVFVTVMTLGAIGAAVWAVGQPASPSHTQTNFCQTFEDHIFLPLMCHAYPFSLSVESLYKLLLKIWLLVWYFLSIVSYCTMEEDTGLYDGELMMLSDRKCYSISLFVWTCWH